ncbi:MAG: PmoA family protein [Bryobacteraceae bacterium]
MLRLLLVIAAAISLAAQVKPQPFPHAQAVPQPDYQVSFQRDGLEIARYWFNPAWTRPFVFPVIGPAGRSLTRMGHPHDPVTHSHHNSVWISHASVGGVNFWADSTGTGRVIHQRIERLDDSGDEASVLSVNAWMAHTGKVVMNERRLTSVRLLPAGEWLLLIDMLLDPAGEDVTFGKTPFGLIGVRMAKTIGVDDGGGVIRNSEGAVDEPKIFRKRARWVDYSGPIAPGASDGITLMDHPSNPNHPTAFHVRRDGWMGSSFTLDSERILHRGESLRLRYGLYVHSGIPAPAAIEKRWRDFCALPLPSLAAKSR